LVARYNTSHGEAKNWILATLGQMDPTPTAQWLTNSGLEALLAPFYLTAPETNWTRSAELIDSLTFVRKQTVET